MVFRGKVMIGETDGGYLAEKRLIIHLSDGPQTLGEIKQFFTENDVDYTKNGVIKLLNRLEKKGKIKKEFREKEYPLYYLSKKSLRDVSLMGTIFRYDAVTTSLNKLSSAEGEKGQSILLKKIVEIIGLYSFSAYLHGYNFEGNVKQFGERKELWYQNIGVNDIILDWLDAIMITFWDESQHEVLTPMIPSFGPSTMRWGEKESKISKEVAQKVKKKLCTLYPKEMQVFDDVYKQTGEQLKEYHNLVQNYS